MTQSSIRRTKIVATLGPAWDTPEQMSALLDAGVDVVRVNSSHGTAEVRERWIRELREVLDARQAHQAAAVLVDLRGPRIRVGALPEARRLATGTRVVFAPEAEAAPDEIPTTYEGLARDVIRAVQQARRDAGLDISDRISLTVSGDDEVWAATVAYEKLIMMETLSVQFGSAGSAHSLPQDQGVEALVGDNQMIRILVKKI